MLNFFKKKTELDILRKEFNFLQIHFGYKLIKEETQSYYKGENLLVFRNNTAQKQIEICGGVSFFNCIIRKIQSGELSDYDDQINNIDFEDLAMADNPNYDHSEFYAGGKNGVIGVAKQTSKLFKNQKTFLTTNIWIDIHKVETLKNGPLNSRFRTVKNNKPEFFIDKVREMVNSEFPEFKLTFSNQKLPFYHRNSTLERLIYEIKDNQIEIEQYDWRDIREIYTIFLNGSKINEIDISKFNDENEAIDEIKKACNIGYK